MPFISAPAILATKNAAGTVIVQANTALRFSGAVVVSVDGPGQTLINVGGGGLFANTSLTNLVAPVQPNQDIDLQNTQFIINSPDPVNPQDVATKFYVDNFAPAVGWSLGGNAVIAGQFFGSTNAVDVEMRYNNIQYALLDATGLNLDQGTYIYRYATDSFDFGQKLTGGTINTVATGSFAFGDAQNAGIIQAQGVGSSSSGSVDNGAIITSAGIGAKAFGFVDNASSIQASGNGSQCFGVSDAGVALSSQGPGSFVFGVHTGATGTIDATEEATMASGFVDASTGNIRANADAGFARGYMNGTGQIGVVAGGEAGVAWGYSSGSGTISVSGQAGWAVGFVTNAATISATSAAAFVFGYADTNNITGAALGSFTGGYSLTGAIVNNGAGSIVWGDEHSSDADFGQSFGRGQSNNSFLSMYVGRYGSAGGTPGVWVTTEQLFVVANGTNAAARNDAFTIFKDARMQTTASQVHTAIQSTGGALAINARTDRTIIYDTNGAGGALTLPAGETGLEFLFGRANAGAGSFALTPNGGDVLGPGVPATLDSTTDGLHIQFLAGTWYKVA